MAYEFFSYDPIAGVTTLYDYDEENDLALFHRSEDVSGIMKVASETRATQPASYLGSSDETWFPQAIIPVTVMAELLKKGIDVAGLEDKDAAAVAKEIEQNYPYLKLTDRRIWRPT